MNQITIIIICFLFMLGIMYLMFRSFYLKELNKALKQADYEQAQEMLHRVSANLLLSQYLKDLYQARIFYLAEDESALMNQLRAMMAKNYEKADEEQYLTLYYHIFLNQGNKDFALELLERIHQCENAKLIRYCDWTKAVLLDEQNDLCDEIAAAIDNKDYYAFALGTCTYLIGIQKKRMDKYEEALLWFDAAKDVFLSNDIYRADVLKEINLLHEMGVQELLSKKKRQ